MKFYEVKFHSTKEALSPKVIMYFSKVILLAENQEKDQQTLKFWVIRLTFQHS